MSIKIRHRDNEHGMADTLLPDPDRIPVAPVRAAWENTLTCGRKKDESRAALEAASTARRNALAEAETTANAAAADGGAVPAKALQKTLRAAEEAVAEAQLEHRARVHAYVVARRDLIEVMQKHTPAWRAAALEDLDRGIAKLATAREAALRAGTEATGPLSVLELLRVLPQTRQPILPSAGLPASALHEALTHLANAIGSAMEAAAQHRAILSDAIDSADAAKAEGAAADSEEERIRAIHAERAERRAKARDDG